MVNVLEIWSPTRSTRSGSWSCARPCLRGITRWWVAKSGWRSSAKSLQDFVQTVIRSRRRFHIELRRLQGYEHACIVVKGSLRDVLDGRYAGGAHTNSVFGAVVSICVDWGVPVFFCGDRQTARRFVEVYLEHCTWVTMHAT